MAIDATRKQEIIQKHQIHEKDTGSPEAQVAVLNARIKELTQHFQTHKKITIQDMDYFAWSENNAVC